MELFFKSQLEYPFKRKIFRYIPLNLRETKTHINYDDCQGMCSNTAIVTNLTERFVINPKVFYCVKREMDREKDSSETFLNLLDFKNGCIMTERLLKLQLREQQIY